MERSVEARLRQALRSHQAGDRAGAETIYREILATDPRHARAWLYLGVLLYQRGELDAALDHIGRSLAEEPNDLAAWNNLALVRSARQEWTEVLACAREVLERDPRHAMGGTHRAAGLLGLGRATEAVEALRQVVSLQPDHADAWLLLAHALRIQGRRSAADEAACQILRRFPDLAMGYYQRALVARDAGDADWARRHVERACLLAPGRVEPQVLRAVCRGEAAAAGSHELAEAIDELERLAKAHPSSVETHQSLGGLLRLAGEPRRAVETLRAALLAFPRSTEIRVQLAAALRDLQETSEAIQVLRAAVLDAPRDLDLLNNLASVLRDERRYSDAMEILNVGIRVAPDHVPLRMNRASLWGRLHHPEAARADLAWVEHAAEEIAGEGPPSVSRELLQLRIACLNPGVFDDGQAMRGFRQALQQSVERLAGKVDLQAWIASGEVRYAPVPPMTLLDQPEENRSIRAAFAAVVGGVRTPERPADVRDGWIPTPASGPGTPPAVHASTPRPRVGFFVSPRHEGAFQRCMAGILRRLPTERFDLRVFGTPSSCQRLSHTFEGSSVQLAVVPARLDRMAETIRQAAVQLLFYWETGTDAWNYYLPFLRPASRQATSWGIPDTSGHPELDFYFSSRLVESPGVDRSSALAYSERLLLADTLLTYQVPPREPWVPENWRETLGLPAGKTVYLCSQNLAKVHPDFDGLLLEILRGDPRGVVVLFADREQTLADRLRRRLAGRSAELAERSLFLPHQPYEDYLRTLATADVLLDTVHCGGGLTAYDAFALGKPMVTWPGVHARARYVQACYQKMGWRNGVADSADAYVALALQWGKDPACRMQAEAEVRSLRGTLFEDPSAPSEFARLLDDALERPL